MNRTDAASHSYSLKTPTKARDSAKTPTIRTYSPRSPDNYTPTKAGSARKAEMLELREETVALSMNDDMMLVRMWETLLGEKKYKK